MVCGLLSFSLQAKLVGGSEVRAVTRTLIRVCVYSYIHVLPDEFFFSNEIDIDQFEKKSVRQDMNIRRKSLTIY